MGACCSKKRIETPLSELAADLKTGDLLLLRGGRILSEIVLKATQGSFSHTGMVIRFEDEGDSKIYMVHSTPNPGKAMSRNETETRQGAIITDLEVELRSGIYSAAAVRRLDRSRYPASKEAQKGDMSAEQAWEEVLATWREFVLHHVSNHTPYEASKLDLIRSSFSCVPCCHNSYNERTLFCSEFVSASYSKAGILKLPENDKALDNPSEWTPQDLAHHKGVFMKAQYFELPDKMAIGCCAALFNFHSEPVSAAWDG